jgi:uncharacterized membrane protein YraQ (UPF0718 family)
MDFQTLIPMLAEAGRFFAFAFAELMVLFVGISFLVGVINEYISPEKVEKVLSDKKGHGYFVGAGLGALTPFCSCSTIPITVGLLKAGAGFGPTMSFLFASPLVNPVLIGLFLAAFGLKTTSVYSAMALLMSIGVGYTLKALGLEKHIRKDAIGEVTEVACGCQPANPTAQLSSTGELPMLQAGVTPEMEALPSANAACCATATAPVASNRWARVFREAINQFKTFIPYILLGVSIGAVFHGFVPDVFVMRYAGPENPLAVPVAAVIGVPLYVRASTMVPVAMSLMGKGMSLGAVIALVIGGAGASIPEVVMLKRIFRFPILAAFLVSVFGMAISAGYVLNLLQ